jgi:xanthosine utilization system XapX-like protein
MRLINVKISIMAAGWALFAAGVVSNVVYVGYNWPHYQKGIAIGYGVMALVGLLGLWVGQQLLDMQRRLDRLEKRVLDE